MGDLVGFGADASSVASASRQSTFFSVCLTFFFLRLGVFATGHCQGRYVDRGGGRDTARLYVRDDGRSVKQYGEQV